MSDTPLSLTLFGVAVAFYVAALIAFVVYVPFRRRRIAGTALGLVALGWPFHLASILTRAFEAGHWPLGNIYEYSTGISFVVATVFLVISLRAGQRLLGAPAMILTIGLMAVAYMLYVPPGNLVPALHSYWLTIHVTSMATASGLLVFSSFFAMFFLARRWADGYALATAQTGSRGSVAAGGGGAAVLVGGGGGGGGGFMPSLAGSLRHLPAAKTLDAWSFRFVMIGFPVWTFGVMMGAVWGEHAWGRYWGWDPKETFSFIVWVVFAIYLHARVTYGWRETRAALITVVGLVAIFADLYAVNLWIAGLHSYARA
ncbi:MAG: c-type cytochrome biogenesis protein CcsB [Candidatus Dormibacteraeota bacterium]|uniref:C-type cytochrome biogenesis protein CcsB n=1 Tax=Candidatus Aeolococcus gillhamiae TaxID=3127015 RepID=A0A2W5ZE59_9BACT|nr:c-type cytochrome biogenesis protein CcsB [Candidatus Dormibacteraeota bacterium]PZR83680.1 MAG: c-type cytochrome biogenesis protein CcsB [Candidatus Dormibacter sp. RRmetagenome_bin12]